MKMNYMQLLNDERRANDSAHRDYNQNVEMMQCHHMEYSQSM